MFTGRRGTDPPYGPNGTLTHQGHVIQTAVNAGPELYEARHRDQVNDRMGYPLGTMSDFSFRSGDVACVSSMVTQTDPTGVLQITPFVHNGQLQHGDDMIPVGIVVSAESNPVSVCLRGGTRLRKTTPLAIQFGDRITFAAPDVKREHNTVVGPAHGVVGATQYFPRMVVSRAPDARVYDELTEEVCAIVSSVFRRLAPQDQAVVGWYADRRTAIPITGHIMQAAQNVRQELTQRVANLIESKSAVVCPYGPSIGDFIRCVAANLGIEVEMPPLAPVVLHALRGPNGAFGQAMDIDVGAAFSPTAFMPAAIAQLCSDANRSGGRGVTFTAISASAADDAYVDVLISI